MTTLNLYEWLDNTGFMIYVTAFIIGLMLKGISVPVGIMHGFVLVHYHVVVTLSLWDRLQEFY